MSLFTIEAEDYIAPKDSTADNQGGEYRDSSIDVLVSSKDKNDYFIGNIKKGEYLTYTVDITESGEYQLDAKVASGKDGYKQFNILVDEQVANFKIGNTGGWQAWQGVSALQTVSLSAGRHTIKVNMLTGGFNFNSFNLVSVGSQPPDNSGSQLSEVAITPGPTSPEPASPEIIPGPTSPEPASPEITPEPTSPEIIPGPTSPEPASPEITPEPTSPDSTPLQIASGRIIPSQSIKEINLGLGNSISAGTQSQAIQGNSKTQSVSYAQATTKIIANLDDAVVLYGGKPSGNPKPVGNDRLFKIMPLGDSITRGGQPDDPLGYRDDLEDLLKDSGYEASFVGRSAGEEGHAGVPGNQISDISNRIDGLLDDYNPDAVLLMAGTNNILKIKIGSTKSNQDAIADVVKQLADLVVKIKQKSPSTRIFVASIPPNTISSRRSDLVNLYNDQITAKVINKYTNTTFVDINSRLSSSDILGDKIHVSAGGNQKIAQAWSGAFQSVYPLKEATVTSYVDTLNKIVNIEGSAYDDVLIGNSARNTLIGGAGDDVLTGGKGADRFVLAPNSGFDVITDFNVGQDLIVLSGGLNTQRLGIASGSDYGFGDNNSLLLSNGEKLALISGVQPDSLTANSFRFV